MKKLLLPVLLFLLSACSRPENDLSPRTMVSHLAMPQNAKRNLSVYQVTGIAMDAKDLIWLGTTHNLNSFDGQNTRTWDNGRPSDEEALPSSAISCLFNDHNRTVWIGTDAGLCTYERFSRFRNYHCDGARLGKVEEIAETSDQVLLVKTAEGFYRLDETQDLHLVPSLKRPSAESKVLCDDNGGLWICTATESVHYDRYFNPADSIRATSPSANVNPAAVRVGDRMWMLSGAALLCVDVNTGARDFRLDRAWTDRLNLCAVDGHYLLFQNEDTGIRAFDTRQRRFVDDALPYIPTTPSRTDISFMYQDPLGNLWIGYRHYGVKCIPRDQKELELLNDCPAHRLTERQYIQSLVQDGSGTIWGSIGRKLFRLRSASGDISFLDIEEISGPDRLDDAQAMQLAPDGTDRLWIRTRYQLLLADISRDRPHVLHKWNVGPYSGASGISAGGDYYLPLPASVDVFHPDGRIDRIPLAGTACKGETRLLDCGDGKVLVVRERMQPLLLDIREASVSDFKVAGPGDLPIGGTVAGLVLGRQAWLASTKDGLWILDLDSHELRREAALEGLHILSIVALSDNTLILGAAEGIVYYDTAQDMLRVYQPSLSDSPVTALTPGGIARSGKNVILGSNDGCVQLPASIPMTSTDHHLSVHSVLVRDQQGFRMVRIPQDESSCVLGHDHNSFEIGFGTIHYDQQPISIQYKLDGYNTDWIDVVRESSAVYAKIPAGKYRFQLREIQSFTDRVISEQQMEIVVKPSPWLTWPAILLYILAALLAVNQLIRFIVRLKSDKLRLSVAEQKTELEHRANEMNMSFFANIAHEFRNPLTIISGPLSSLLKDRSVPADAHKKLLSISASANSMLRLIDQMLDFNQLEMDVLRLCVGEHDVTHEISRILGNFEESANLRDISIRYDGLEDPFISLVDLDKLEKILSNLFTNALKHTPDGGAITMAFDDVTGEEARAAFGEDSLGSSRYFQVDITNNGKQIADDKIGNVFKRYYQSSETSLHHDYGWGRGIGLYFVQRLVQVHHGAIRVFNTPEGVCFSFVIPTDRECYADADRENANVHRILQIEIPQDTRPEKKVPEDVTKPVLLVVDDDIQVGQYIRTLFEERYNVTNKYSAESALSEIDKINPDIIISDVVMGKMSGYEFCRTLKSDLTYSHIPFILLTAKTDVEDSVSGLECGANAYVTKPFSAEYLSALVDSQRKNMENLRTYLNQTTEASLSEGNLSEQDRNFINDLYKLMDKHLSEADLSVTTICEELRISRSKFNYKLKGLTGSTPGSFFRHYKLNLAAKMLKEGRHNVSEIADMMGFASISNFSASFKKMFGVSPKDYK